MLKLLRHHPKMTGVALFLWFQVATTLAVSSSSPPPPTSVNTVLSLQLPHASAPPADALREVAQECDELEISSWDVYGDYALNETTSYLRKFERQVAGDLGKQDAVFMPSGVMAQSIALLIHSRQNPNKSSRFICHASSHLLLHEAEAYRELLRMEPIVVSTPVEGCSHAPMSMADVNKAVDALNDDSSDNSVASTLILELPHRELGGKCTSWKDIQQLQEFCHSNKMALHCDGARIFEATAAYDKSLAELAEPFDSVYISCYKGLAGLSGALLVGTSAFCDEARVWLRRFGGNLYTQLPYAVSGWRGYRRHWLGRDFSFVDKRDKLRRIVAQLSNDSKISKEIQFDPSVPQVNMVHCYLYHSAEECKAASEVVEAKLGIRVLSRIRDVEAMEPAHGAGFRTKFEWTLGEANGAIPEEIFVNGWRELIDSL